MLKSCAREIRANCKLAEIEVLTVKKWTLTPIILFALGILLIIMTFLQVYVASLPQHPGVTIPETTDWGNLAIGIILVAVAAVITRKAED
jgi:hypothetical protein